MLLCLVCLHNIAPAGSKNKLRIILAPAYRAGTRYRSHLTAEWYRTTKLRFADDSSERESQMQILLAGTLTVLSTDDSGRVVSAEFAIQKISGTFNRHPLGKQLTGHTLTIDLHTPASPIFRLKGQPVDSIPPDAQTLLRLLFPSILREDFRSLVGTPPPSAQKKFSWLPPYYRFAQLLKKQKINFTPANLNLTAQAEPNQSWQGTNCTIITERLKTVRLDDFHFNYNLQLWLPQHDGRASTPPLRVLRQAVWRAGAKLPVNMPLTGGHAVSTTIVNSIDLIMVPLAPSQDEQHRNKRSQKQ